MFTNLKHYTFLIIGFLLIISSIIPKGAWSYFNDVEEVPNTLAVGRCSFNVNPDEVVFEFTNVIPEEESNSNQSSNELNFTITNTGDFNMDHLFLDTNFTTDSAAREEYAQQFEVAFSLNGVELDKKWTIAQLAEATKQDQSPDIVDWLGSKLKPGEGNNKLDVKISISLIKHDNIDQSQFEGKSIKVAFLINGICGNIDGGIEDENDGNKNEDKFGDWDKSSLYVKGQAYGFDGSQIYAYVKNTGSGNMSNSAKYKVYWVKNGGKPNATIEFENGVIPQLQSGETYKMTYKPTKPGKYWFKVFQEEGHPGEGVAWSDEITVK